MPLICYQIVTTTFAPKPYIGHMRIETVQPLFSFLDGGLFIQQANTLVDQYDLRHRWDRTPGDMILAPELGRTWIIARFCISLTVAVSRV